MEQQQTSKSKEKVDMLPRTMADITPIEPRVDSFSTSIEQPEMQTKGTGEGETLASIQIHTPPETPELPHLSTIAPCNGQDPTLFPDSPLRDRSRSYSPLIIQVNKDPEGKRLVEEMNLNEHEPSTERFHGSSFDQHRKNATYPGILGIRSAQDALDFHRSCVDEQKRWRAELALPAPALSAKGARRDVTSKEQVSRLNKSSGVSKPHAIPVRPTPKPVAVTTTLPPRKATATKKRFSKAKATSEGPSETSQGRQKHTRAAPTKHVTVSAQKGWREIEDVSPPLSTLNGKSHETKWNGSMKDNSDEDDLEYLHELERRWASRLRLTPKLYLSTKRLIFIKKLEALRAGKAFTKTAAQAAASLDVNKLSRLHEAFDTVGWFDEKHFQQYLQADALD